MKTIVNARGVTLPAVTIAFASGATRVVAESTVTSDDMKVLGLSDEGRIVVNYYPNAADGGWRFGLTLCCQASDTGTDTGVVCRCCYGTQPNADEGEYDAIATDPYVGIIE